MPADQRASVGGDAPPLRTRQEIEAGLALAALERGRAAIDDGAPREALRWFQRAARFAPEDASVRLSLGGAQLACGDLQAAAVSFQQVADTADLREAWMALALVRVRLGDHEHAAAALHACLSRHRCVPGPAIEAIAAALGRVGWCGLGADERLVIAATESGRQGGSTLIVTAGGRTADPKAPIAADVAAVRVRRDGRDVLGSPIDVARIRRVEGIVWAEQGGLAGWAWHPADAERDPVLSITDGRNRRTLVAADIGMTAPRPLMRPRRFVAPAALLDGLRPGPLTVLAADGRKLAGSPLDPDLPARAAAAAARRVASDWPATGRPRRRAASAAELVCAPAATRGRSADAPLRPLRPVAIVVPAYRGTAETLACLAAVRSTVPAGTRIIVVDDASPEPALVAALDRAAAERQLTLITLPSNQGFPAAANAGLRAALALRNEPDIVLLNSDTRPAPGWLEALRAAVQGAPDIGTATPLSNDATILSYPHATDGNDVPSPEEERRLARLAARANPGVTVEIPTAIGFCMYVRRECLVETGLFREDLFGQGYGEENDFSLRARYLGWRHVAVPGAFVTHVGGRSFGAAKIALLARNGALLNTVHPGYDALIAAFTAADPLAAPRRRLDALRFRAVLRRGSPKRETDAVVLITHAHGGGVERFVQSRAALWRGEGRLPILLRPRVDATGWCRVEVGDPAAFPNLEYTLPAELDALAALLRPARPALIEVHHLLGHDHAVLELAARLGIPYDLYVHDFALYCSRITLVGGDGRYCGEPDVAGCVACVADHGTNLLEPIGPVELLARSSADLAGARRVLTPSADTAQRLSRRFPGIAPIVLPHEAEGGPGSEARLVLPQPGEKRRICVVGGIGTEKGYDVLLACARDAAGRDLPLSFHLVGHTSDDERLLATGRVDITGPYKPEQVESLIRAQQAAVCFIPSVWPETWCFAMSEAWRAGLPVVAFDIGAQAERIRGSGRGWLLPLGLAPARVNETFLTLRALAVHGSLMHTGHPEVVGAS